MLVLVLILVALTAIFASLVRHLSHDPLERSAIGLLGGLIVLMYAPQLAYFTMGSLRMANLVTALAGLTVGIGLALRWAARRFPTTVTVSVDHQLFGQFSRSPYLLTLAGTAAIIIAASAWISTHYWQFDWDGWSYHSSALAWFYQQNALTPMPLVDWIIGYPKNIEFLGLWAFLLEGSDQHIDSVNLLLHIVTLPFAYGLGRRIGLDSRWALAGALLYFLTPTLAQQTWTTYVDQAFADSIVIALFFLFTWMQSEGAQRHVWTVLLGCTLGHLAHTKGTGLHVMLLVGAFVVIYEVRAKRARQLPQQLALLAAPTVLLGAGWYLHTWWLMGNPFFPYQIHLPISQQVLFPGPINFKQSLMTNLGISVRVHDPLPVLYYRMFGQSGWGLQFFALGLPAALLCLFKGNAAMRWLVGFGIAYLVVTPFSYIDRYAVFVTLVGALAFAYGAQHWLAHLRWARILLPFSAVAIVLSAVPVLQATKPDMAGPFHPPPVDAFATTEGFKRFALVNALPPGLRIGVTDLTSGSDDPYWYFYFGPRWQNRVEPFDVARAAEYDVVVCSARGGRCAQVAVLGLFSRVLIDADVEVYRRDNK